MRFSTIDLRGARGRCRCRRRVKFGAADDRPAASMREPPCRSSPSVMPLQSRRGSCRRTWSPIRLAGQVDAGDRARHARCPSGQGDRRPAGSGPARPARRRRSTAGRDDEDQRGRRAGSTTCASATLFLRFPQRPRVHRLPCRDALRDGASRARSSTTPLPKSMTICTGPDSGMCTSLTVPRNPPVVSTSSPTCRSRMSFCCLLCSCCCGRRTIR